MSTLAVLEDFKAAYDTVWRPMLLHKLSNSGISGNLCNWIKSFLSQRLICVRPSNSTSKYRIQKQGLAQGAVLSCPLFNLLINDVIESDRIIQGIQVLLYADDLLIWATSGNILALYSCLNRALEILGSWATKNAITVSISTLHTIHQNLTAKTTIQLEHIRRKRYLGVLLDRRLTWKPHIEQCADRAKKRSRLLKRLPATTWGASQDILTTTYIQPVLEFGTEATITTTSSPTGN